MSHHSSFGLFKVAFHDTRNLDVDIHHVSNEHINDLISVGAVVNFELFKTTALVIRLIGLVSCLYLPSLLVKPRLELTLFDRLELLAFLGGLSFNGVKLCLPENELLDC